MGKMFLFLCKKASQKIRLSLILIVLFSLFATNMFAAGNADVSISTSSANGAWSFASSTYTWTPSANSSTVDNEDIQNCLLGSGTLGGSGIVDAAVNGVGSVIILTACSGAGSQTGDVTHSTVGITAATTTTTQRTFTITAAGSITIGQTITFTPGSNGGTGYPSTNVVLTGPSGVSITQPIASVGGATTGAAATGGVGGSLTCTASGGTVTIGNTITLTGGTGGSGGGAGTGGAGGAVTLSGQTISITQPINTVGGAGSDTGSGGAGGAINITSTSTTVTISNGITSTGGVGAGGGSPGNGGNGGAITITAQTNFALSAAALTSDGGTGAGNGNGGAGGNITIVATTGSVANTHILYSKGGPSGVSAANQSGGNGGAITVTAGTTYSTTQPIDNSGGTCRGTGSSNGGAITITAPGGYTSSNTITSSYGAGGAAGTSGTLTINDGYATVTSGGVNDGQTSAAAWTVGALTKTGTGNLQITHTSNSWSGATTITDGKLTLGAAAVIPDASQLDFNGGRLVMGAYSETVGTIKISSYSVLDLPVGNYTLTCSASNGVSWTAGQKLGINNWLGGYDGTAAGGSDPKFKTGASAELDAGHLAQIYFRRTSNGLSYTATQLASGEIVPTGTLPVKLISFEAKKNKNQVDLGWQTASEINSDYFEIFRSTDNINWESIGKISAAGTSNKIIKYSFTDDSPKEGINYYQLKEYDFDGTQQESKVVFISNGGESALLVYPNPVNGSIFFDFYSENGGTHYLKAFNINAQEVYSAIISGIPGSNHFNFSMQDFAAGVYSFQLFDNVSQNIAVTKVVKVD